MTVDEFRAVQNKDGRRGHSGGNVILRDGQGRRWLGTWPAWCPADILLERLDGTPPVCRLCLGSRRLPAQNVELLAGLEPVGTIRGGRSRGSAPSARG